MTPFLIIDPIPHLVLLSFSESTSPGLLVIKRREIENIQAHTFFTVSVLKHSIFT